MTAGDGDARVSDADRERTVVRLREAHVEGRLTLDELSDSAGLVYRARTERELARIVAELPPAPPLSRKLPKRCVLAIFAGRTVSGRWRPGGTLVVASLFGGTDIDLREATLDSDGLTIYALALFGGNDFYVLEDVEVDLRGTAVFGGADEHGSERPGASPLVRVVAFSLFGANDVRHVPLGKSVRELKLGLLRDLVRGRALS